MTEIDSFTKRFQHLPRESNPFDLDQRVRFRWAEGGNSWKISAWVLRRARGAPPLANEQVEMGLIWITFLQKETNMKETKKQTLPQPETFTPGITKGMVRQHAFQIYQDKLAHGSLTLEDWVLAEKDLVQTMQTDGVVK